MAQQNASNYPIPAAANVKSPYWKLTRVMKAAGWNYKASGVGIAALKDTSGTAANDLLGGNATPMNDTYTTSGTTTTATQNLPGSGGSSTIALTSSASFSAGGGTACFLTTANGWQNVTYTGLSGNSLTGCSGGTGAIVSGYPVAAAASSVFLETVAWWIVLAGPNTIKIPLNAAPTGTFLRGETITQATTAAEGEILGFVWDSVGGSGWMAVLARTGTWDNAHTITGSTSGATATPLTNGTLVQFQREFMFWADTGLVNGTIYYGCFDGLEGGGTGTVNLTPSTTTIAVGSNGNALPQATINVASTSGFAPAGYLLINTTVGLQLVQYTGTSGGNQFTGGTGGTGTINTGNSVTQSGAEGSQLFSTLATASGCTGILGPAMGGTNNAFPTMAWCVKGTAGSNAASPWCGNDNASFQTNAQIGCTNTIASSGVSPDGSFFIACSNSSTVNTATGMLYTRVDDTEPGDCDPFVVLNSAGGGSLTTLTHSTTQNTHVNTAYTFNWSNFRSGSFPAFFGYQARGNGTLDTVNAYTACPMGDPINVSNFAIGQAGLANPMRVVNSPATTRPLMMEPVPIYTSGLAAVTNSKPQIKGRCRWLFGVAVGTTYDTYASKTLLCVFVATGISLPSLAIGPFDGTTTPVQ